MRGAALGVRPTGPDAAEWAVWSTTARLVVTDPAALPAARRIVCAELAAIDAAASRFRQDSEIQRLRSAGGRATRISPLLAELVAAACDAAERTGGDVDPTVGNALVRLGYDRDISLLGISGAAVPVVVAPAVGWRAIRLEGRSLTVPDGVLLDLGATAKAVAADRSAMAAATTCGTGVLVSLGGDIATAGPAPDGGWRVLVHDLPADPPTTVGLAAGAALATSSSQGRQWRRGGRLLHHILDPRTCQPVPKVWRSVTVAAADCLTANTLSTAAMVRGRRATDWLRGRGVAARLVNAKGLASTVGDWPEETAG